MTNLSIATNGSDWTAASAPHWETAEANPAKLPQFEGQDVAFAKAKLTSVSALEVDDEVLRLDQMVRMNVEGRVVRIDHVVNAVTGSLERIQTIKVIEGIILHGDDH